ncbi:hypothetical protein GCM10027271_27290 [Saccharopolyspora gloriosae]|uniref:Uncharacterized protein YukE n=1 Tax=Saccharopolyspora gloriosae TaxID=455344 RepID=A0A840NK39_9PSEU|nr:hypothetical protein [Saccharopolyspora gloriosae]MBB5071431.1 uncharacterized protein YukE [Saccharopolyspora gloriosae]
MAAQLGDTDDPTELVPGDVAGTGDKADTLRRIADGLGAVRRIDSEHAWTGPAADAYRKTVRDEQQRWDVAAAAFGKAASALTDHGNALRSAQDKAARAIELHRQGEQDSARAEKAHAAQVKAAGPEDRVAPFQDPGAAKTAEAQAILDQARSELRSASAATRTALKQAAESAPDPSVLERLADMARATGGTYFEAYKSFTGGALGAVGEMGMGVLGMAAKPLHLMTDPAATISAGFSAGAGIVHMVTTKEGWGQTIGSLDEWKKDPAAALGKAATNIGTTVAGGGAGAGAKAAGLGGKVGRVGKLAPEAPSGSPFDGAPPVEKRSHFDPPYGYDEHGPRLNENRPAPEPEPEPEPVERNSPDEDYFPRGRPDWMDEDVLDPMNPGDGPSTPESEPPRAAEPPSASWRAAAEENLQRLYKANEEARDYQTELEQHRPQDLAKHREDIVEIRKQIRDLEARLR